MLNKYSITISFFMFNIFCFLSYLVSIEYLNLMPFNYIYTFGLNHHNKIFSLITYSFVHIELNHFFMNFILFQITLWLIEKQQILTKKELLLSMVLSAVIIGISLVLFYEFYLEKESYAFFGLSGLIMSFISILVLSRLNLFFFSLFLLGIVFLDPSARFHIFGVVTGLIVYYSILYKKEKSNKTFFV